MGSNDPEEHWNREMTTEERMEIDPYGEAISRMKIAFHSAMENSGAMSDGEMKILQAINEILEAA